MPFENLQPRLGAIQPQPVPHFNNTPVAPIGAIIEHGARQVASILDTFNPLNQAERKAKIAHATYITKLYQDAQSPNPAIRQQALAALSGHAMESLEAKQLKIELIKSQIAHTKALTAKARGVAVNPNDIYRMAAGIGAAGAAESSDEDNSIAVVPEQGLQLNVNTSLGDDESDQSLMNDNP